MLVYEIVKTTFSCIKGHACAAIFNNVSKNSLSYHSHNNNQEHLK